MANEFTPECGADRRGVAPNVRTSQSGSSSETCRPELTVIDALGVGLSLAAMVRSQPMPAETRETYIRVGQQLEAAAKLALRGGGK